MLLTLHDKNHLKPAPPALTNIWERGLRVFNDFKDLRVVGMSESKRSDTLGYRTFHKISKAVLLFYFFRIFKVFKDFKVVRDF